MIEPQFPADRSGALGRLEDFLLRARHYAAVRNQVAPGHAGVSRLSPAIRTGLISEQEVVRAVLARHPLAAVEKFIQEVFWRTYWKGWLHLRPQVWTAYLERRDWWRKHAPEAVRHRAAAVAGGQSGVAIMDRFARELVETGYLHNHARLWWASFWIHVERLPWELGADFFLRHLLDADPASNTLSWRWVAGLQTPGKFYLVRRSNLERYCAPELLSDTTGLDRLDDGRVVAAEIPEIADRSIGRSAFDDDTASPPNAPYGLWVHEEDCNPDLGGAMDPPPSRLIAAGPDAPESPAECPAPQQRLLTHALADAGRRLCAQFMLPLDAPESGSIRSRRDRLRDFARRHGLRTLAAMAPSVGPLADALPALRSALARDGVSLLLFRRPWDSRHWPQAHRGYFSFWASARSRLAEGQSSPELAGS
ncbi:MAG: DNA photolyase FAD-binding protein [Verrucomicrobia bacterium]|nr:DNA photolyase FAD-binding protein [Verrucomicrobiota bacterium]